MAAKGRKINPDKIDPSQPRITDFFRKVKGTMNTHRPDGAPSVIEEKGEISGRSELSRKRSLGGEAEKEEGVPLVGATPPKISRTQTESEAQGPSEVSAASSSLKAATPKLSETQAEKEVVAETQSYNVLDKATKVKKKVPRSKKRKEYKSMETVPVSPTESSDNNFGTTVKETDGASYVFFGLETGKKSSALRRIVAVHGNNQLDTRVLSRTAALVQFINFLTNIPNPVLAGHNAEAFQFLELCRILEYHYLWKEFISYIPLFVDTLTVFKEEYPDQKQFKINDLTKIVLGENALPVRDDLLEEVKALQEICLLDRKDKYKIKDKFHEHKRLMRSLGLPKKRMVNHKVPKHEQ